MTIVDLKPFKDPNAQELGHPGTAVPQRMDGACRTIDLLVFLSRPLEGADGGMDGQDAQDQKGGDDR